MQLAIINLVICVLMINKGRATELVIEFCYGPVDCYLSNISPPRTRFCIEEELFPGKYNGGMHFTSKCCYSLFVTSANSTEMNL